MAQSYAESSLDSQISASFSNPLSLLSEVPDVKKWFSSYEYESPSQGPSLLDLFESETCPCEEVGDGEKAVGDVVFETEDICEESCIGLSSEENEFVVGAAIPAAHDGESDPLKMNECSGVSPEKSEEGNLSVSLQVSHDSFFKLAKKHILDTHDVECATVSTQAVTPSLENIDRHEQSSGVLMESKYTNEMDNSVQKIKQDLEPERCFPGPDMVLKSDRHTENTATCITELEDDKENCIEVNTKWISTRLPKCESSIRKEPTKPTLLSEQKNVNFLSMIKAEPLRKRGAFADMANLAPGKWQCPSKKKAKLGPPLKQLRMDKWVRRLI